MVQDATLKRCFGKEDKLINWSWDQLSKLQTLKAPHESLPRLLDLLRYLNTPGLEDIWLLLDIKVGQQSEFVERELIASVARQQPG